MLYIVVPFGGITEIGKMKQSWEEEEMRRQRNDLGAGVGKAQGVKPIEKASAVGYRKDIYNSMRCISVKNRDTRRYIVSLSGSGFILELEGKIGGKIYELCGEGRDGLIGVVRGYKGVGGVYAFVNIEKKKVYIGSSNDLAGRMGDYKNMYINNKSLLKDVKAGNWEGFIIIVILKEEEKEERIRREYGIISRVREITGVRLYNVFIRKEYQESYGEKVTLARGVGVLGDTREKIRKKAIEQGRGERQKEYWFKEGLEHQLANKVRLIDTKTGLSQVVLVSMVPSITGGSNYGVWDSMEKNTIYKGRYIIKGQEIRNKEVILEDKETGEKRVVELGEVPGITGGTRKGVWEAIKGNRIYKKRYELKYIEEKKATQVLIRVENTTDGSIKEVEMKEAVELTKGTEDGIRKAIKKGNKYKKRYLLSFLTC